VIWGDIKKIKGRKVDGKTTRKSGKMAHVAPP
jgi:hypothetical protein